MAVYQIGEGYYGIDAKGVKVDPEVAARIDAVFRQIAAEKPPVILPARPETSPAQPKPADPAP